jgi:hypothetical protein
LKIFRLFACSTLAVASLWIILHLISLLQLRELGRKVG